MLQLRALGIYYSTPGNAFVTELDPTGASLLYFPISGAVEDTTYESNAGINDPVYWGDVGLGIAVDRSGDIYVTGSAASYNFPTTLGAFQAVNNGAALG